MRAQTGYHNTEVPPGLQKGTTWSFTNQAQRVTKRPTVPQNITAQSCRAAAPPTRPRSPPHGEGRAQRREAGRPHEAPQRSTAPRGRSVTVVLREQPPRLQVELLLADLLLEPELQVGPVPAGDRAALLWRRRRRGRGRGAGPCREMLTASRSRPAPRSGSSWPPPARSRTSPSPRSSGARRPRRAVKRGAALRQGRGGGRAQARRPRPPSEPSGAERSRTEPSAAERSAAPHHAGPAAGRRGAQLRGGHHAGPHPLPRLPGRLVSSGGTARAGGGVGAGGCGRARAS